jgi:hypothetical protein
VEPATGIERTVYLFALEVAVEERLASYQDLSLPGDGYLAVGQHAARGVQLIRRGVRRRRGYLGRHLGEAVAGVDR